MARIAGAAGVTPTTIYWYFQDKDDLLVSVLEHLMALAIEQSSGLAELSLTDQALSEVGRLESSTGWSPSCTPAPRSLPMIDSWHTGFHQRVEALLADGLRKAGIAEHEIAARTTLGVFVVEGLLTHRHDDAGKRAIL